MAEARLNVEITAQVASALQQIGALQDQVEGLTRTTQRANLGDSLNKIGAGMSDFGRSMLDGVVNIGGSVIRSAATIETATASLGKAANLSGEELKNLRDEFLDLGLTANNSTVDLIGIGEAISKMGVGRESLAETTKLVSDMSLAFDIGAEQAGEYTGAIAANFGMINKGQADIDRLKTFANTVNNLGDNMAVYEKDVLEFTKRIAGTGKNFNLTENQLAGLGASLLVLGTPAETAARAFEKFFATLTPSELKANQASFKALGVNIAEVEKSLRSGNTEAAIESIFKSISQVDDKFGALDALRDIFGADFADEIQKMGGGFENFAQSFDLVNQAVAGGGNTIQDSVKAVGNTFNVKMDQMANSVTKLQVAIADAGLLDSVIIFVNKITVLTSKLSESNPELLSFGVKALLVAGAIGAILIPLGSFVQLLGTLITLSSSGALATAFPTFIAGFKALAAGIWAVLAPLGIIIAKIALFTGLVVAGAALVYTGIQKLITGFGLLVGKIAEGIKAFEDWIGIPNVISGVLEQISTLLLDYGEKMRQAGSMLMEMLAQGISNAIGKVTGAVSGVAEKAMGFFNSSDAKYGPLSNTTAAGRALPETLAKGVKQGESILQNQIASTLAPTAPTGGGSSVSSPISVNNNITINGNMNNEQRQDLMAQLDAKAQELARMLQRVNDDRMRTKYV